MKKIVEIMKDLGEVIAMLLLMAISIVLMLLLAIPVAIVLAISELIDYIKAIRDERKKSNRGDMREEATTEDSASDSDEY